jgi:hypothetical protein
MSETRDRWAGIHTSVRPHADNEGYNGTYRVSFVWGLAHPRGYGGEDQKVKTTALVLVRAENDGTVLRVSHYGPPEQPLPDRDQRHFEQKALELVSRRIAWIKQVTDLAGKVEQWGNDLGWATRRIEKRVEDIRLGDHQVPALLLQQDLTRVLLEPVSPWVPGADGLVDLSLMPSYDDVASLYLSGGSWSIHYILPGTKAVATVREATAVPLSKEALATVLGEMKKHG